MPSRLDGVFFFFSSPSQHHNWGGGDQSELRADNHILTREIIMWGSGAGQLRVSDTNVTLLSAPLPYMPRSWASVLIALPWTLWLSDGAGPSLKPLEIISSAASISSEGLQSPLVSELNQLPDSELALMLHLSKGFLSFAVFTGLSLTASTMDFNPLLNTVD